MDCWILKSYGCSYFISDKNVKKLYLSAIWIEIKLTFNSLSIDFFLYSFAFLLGWMPIKLLLMLMCANFSQAKLIFQFSEGLAEVNAAVTASAAASRGGGQYQRSAASGK